MFCSNSVFRPTLVFVSKSGISEEVKSTTFAVAVAVVVVVVVVLFIVIVVVVAVVDLCLTLCDTEATTSGKGRNYDDLNSVKSSFVYSHGMTRTAIATATRPGQRILSQSLTILSPTVRAK